MSHMVFDGEDEVEIGFVDGRPVPLAQAFRDQSVNGSNAYREAALAFLTFFDQCQSYIMNSQNPRFAAWIVALATGRTGLTGGISQVELAGRFHCTKANVSKCVKELQAQLGTSIIGLPPMEGQRNLEACRKFARVRKGQLK